MMNRHPASPCCCGVSSRRRGIPADRGWRLLRWWEEARRKRWRREPAAGTPFAAPLPAAWGQHLGTWGACHLNGVTPASLCKCSQRATEIMDARRQVGLAELWLKMCKLDWKLLGRQLQFWGREAALGVEF